MNVFYNSDQYSVLFYPAQEGFELLDKQASRVLFIQGAIAVRFQQAVDAIPEAELDEEAMDDLLASYCAGMAHTIAVH